jgi:RNA polymerase sigma factor (sigma-70 family)
MDLEAAVKRAARGDLDAFADVTRRFQHMAFGYALSYVRNFQDAEDVVQEAFLAAWYALPTLAEPAAFAGWLRSIVRHQAHRVLRRKQLEVVPLTAADAVPADAVAADDRVGRRGEIGRVLTAIGELPRTLREIVVLFYVHDCSQQDIATFLGLPVTTVNNRLHAARAQLKRRMVATMKDTLHAHQLADDFAARIGWIVRARENIVEVRFDPASLPDVLTELAVSDEPRQRAVTLQVVQRLGNGVVRCVAASPVSELSPGMTVMSSGREIAAPVSRESFDRVVQLLAPSTLAPGTLAPTGIKVVDVMCPLVAGGTLAVAGEWRAGTAVVLEELVRRLSGGTERVSIFTFVPGGGTMTYREMMEKEGYSDGSIGSVQTFFFRREDGPWTAESLATLKGVDVVIRLSEALGRLGIYPAVDPLTSRSRLFESSTLGHEHAQIADRVRRSLALVAPVAHETDSLAVARARKLQRFFAQPFFCAEPYTGRPGVTVTLTDALQGCPEILDGVHDDVPEQAFYFTGSIANVLVAAQSPPRTTPTDRS